MDITISALPIRIDAVEMAPAMALALSASFGSVERWRAEFLAIGSALGGGSGSGSVQLTFQPRDARFVIQAVSDHTQALADGVPILALDMGDRSNEVDIGAAPAARVDAFIAKIDWAAVYQRYQQAVHAASEPFGASHDEVEGAVLFDVRRAGVFEQAEAMIPGAQWRDPAAVDAWAGEVPRGQRVLVYCVYGHEVGRSTAMRLRAAGVDARFLNGGIDGWKAAGRAVQAKPRAG